MPRTREEIEEAAAKASAWMESLDPDKIPWRDASPLRSIIAALNDVAEAERRLAGAVYEARKAGMSWGAIGMALGVSREAARQRFG